MFEISHPYGFFTYQPSAHKAVFVATGTGVAPFVAYAKSGIKNFILLHGVGSEAELYYSDLFLTAAAQYVGCLSQGDEADAFDGEIFPGRVTSYLQNQLPSGVYDFYLCGSGVMVRDALEIIDSRFPDSRVFSETFFTPEG